MSTNELNESKPKKKKSVLRIISTILYIMAFASFVIGIIKLIVTGTSTVFNGVNSFMEDEEMFEENIMPSFSGVFSYFLTAIMLAVWGTVLLIIARVIDKRTFVDSTKSFIDDSIEKVADSISKLHNRINGQNPDGNSDQRPKLKVYCAYCGNELDEDERKCPYCGASKKIQKKD